VLSRFYLLDLGVRYMLGASFMFALMGYFVKMLAYEMSSLEIVFFRNIFGVVIIGYALFKKPAKSKGGKPWLLFFRGFMGFSALLLFFYNITVMNLADAMTFSKTSPIFVAIFAFVFLKERLPLRGWLAVGFGFIGMLLVVNPTGILLDKYAITGILSGIGAALAYTSIRELRSYYDSRQIVLSFVGIGTIGPLILMIVGEFVSTQTLDFMIASFVWPSPMGWVYITLMGILATLSQLFMTKSYASTQAGIAGAISYANIPFAVLIGLFLGEGFPDLVTTFGILLIIFAGIMVSKK